MKSGMTREELILSAYDLLCDVTPKKNDCGTLCSAACCGQNTSHGDGDCGMLLLPGEWELICGAPGFEKKNCGDGELLLCDGKCIRSLRPFACRIFPFYPHIEKRGERYDIKILPDPRSSRICPIYSDFRSRKTHVSFLRNAKKAVRVLLRDEEIAKELVSQSEMLADVERLRKAILE